MITELILDIYSYFAKFPDNPGVLRNFTKNESEFDEYLILKNKVETLPKTSLIPEISDFMMGVNDENIRDRLKTTRGYFLFVDYGNILINESSSEIIESSVMLTIGVARYYTGRKFDFVEENIIMNKALRLLTDVLRIMQSDNAETCAFRQYLTFPVEITPLEPLKFYQCAGWGAIFNYKDNSILA